MSNPRLLLCSGAPGAGTTTIARAALRAQRQAGRRAHLVDSSEAPLRDALGSLSAIGPVAGEALLSSPVLERADALVAVATALRDPDLDVVIWDAGPIDEVLTALAACDAIPVIVDHAGGPLVNLAVGQFVPGDRVRQLREVLATLADAARLPAAPSARIVLVEEPTDGLATRVSAVRARLGVLGMALDHVVVNRIPRTKDDWPRDWARARRRIARRFDDRSAIALPWFATGDPVRRAAKRLPDLLRTKASRPDAMTVVQQDDAFHLHLPLAGVDPERVRAGRWHDAVVVEVDGLRRLVSLPSVLRRCTVTGGGMVGEVLVIRFAPDPLQWPAAS